MRALEQSVTGGRTASALMVPTYSLRNGLGAVKFSDAVFCLGFCIYIVQYVLFSTTPIDVRTSYITLGVMLLMLLKVLVTAIEVRVVRGGKLVVMGLLLCLIAMTQASAGTSQLTILAAILLASRHVPPRHIAKTAFWSVLSSATLVLLLMAAGHLPNAVFVQGSRTRYSLGFTYVGMLDLYLLHLALLAIYLRGGRLHTGTVALFVVLHVVAHSQSMVRGTLAIALLVWALYLLFIRRSPKKPGNRILAVLAIASIPVCLIVSVYTALGYQPASPSWAIVNELFSGRLRLAQSALMTYGVTPFGQMITWVGAAGVQSGAYAASEYNYVDSGYLQILIQFGWVTLAVVCAAYVLVAISAARSHNKAFEIWAIAVAVECLIYPNLLLMAYNCLLLLATSTLGDSAGRSSAA